MIVDAQPDAEYLALSYIWASSHDQHGQGTHSLSTAPAVTQDAIAVTLQLSYRYLWVDQFYINQDSPAEKHRQIANMDQIYAGAILTLIAAEESGSTRGLPGVSHCTVNLNSRIQLGHYSYFPLFRTAKEEIETSKCILITLNTHTRLI